MNTVGTRRTDPCCGSFFFFLEVVLLQHRDRSHGQKELPVVMGLNLNHSAVPSVRCLQLIYVLNFQSRNMYHESS